ncbi:MAG: nitroreductase/quinone reductase family protein [Thaumarchaeota archaeon]|nr:nitroreductase/quinone reductase family protein [Nitrososphaerota archaeon]
MIDLRELEKVRKEKYIYLTTTGRKTGQAHTVELWFAAAPGGVYLSHEGPATDWMKNLKKRSKVAARIGKLKFEAEAEMVGPGPEREEGAKALYEKYYKPATKEVIDDWFSLSQVIRLKPA